MNCRSLKGQCHEIFCFWFFHDSVSPKPLINDYTNRADSNFFENSRRYLQLKVCHWSRWHRMQMAKIFKLKNFNYFVWSRVNIYINFCLQVQFHMSAAWYCTHRCQRHQWQICCSCLWYRWQFATGVVDTDGKFATGINNASENGGKICHRYGWYRWQICRWCRWYQWCTLTCKYLANFRKNLKRS